MPKKDNKKRHGSHAVSALIYAARRTMPKTTLNIEEKNVV
jgi:hypothetical protein